MKSFFLSFMMAFNGFSFMYGIELAPKVCSLKDFFAMPLTGENTEQEKLIRAINELPKELQNIIAIGCMSNQKQQLWYEEQQFKHNDWGRLAYFNNDGKKLVTASHNKAACVWDAITGHQLLKVEHNDWVYSACFNKDETKLVTASADNTACIWNTITGHQLLKVEHNDCVKSACFNSDETKIITASADKTAYVWDSITGKQLLKVQHNNSVNSTYFNNDGTKIVTASGDKTACVWDAITGQQLLKVSHDSWINSACFNNDGTKIVTASGDKTACIWNAITGHQLLKVQHNHWVESACFNNDGTKLLTESSDNTAQIWQEYITWTVDQALLYKLLCLWILMEKPDKKSNSIEDFLAVIATKLNLNNNEMTTIWKTFPNKIQSVVWNRIRKVIQVHGK